MRHLFAVLLAGLLVGVGVHVASLMLIPKLVSNGIAARVAALGAENRFIVVPDSNEDASLNRDTLTRLAICRYDLTQGALRVIAPETGSFQTIAFHDREGFGFYVVDEGSASAGSLVVTLYSAAQLADVRARQGPDTPLNLRVEAPADQGFVTVRALVQEPSLAARVEAALAAATCNRVSVPESG